MSEQPILHRKSPCDECPWRKDVTPGKFPTERYRELARTSGKPGEDVPMDNPMFGCHKSAEGKPIACAGWLAAVGIHHLNVRLALALGALPASVLDRGPGWPDLFASLDEVRDHMGGDSWDHVITRTECDGNQHDQD